MYLIKRLCDKVCQCLVAGVWSHSHKISEWVIVVWHQVSNSSAVSGQEQVTARWWWWWLLCTRPTSLVGFL